VLSTDSNVLSRKRETEFQFWNAVCNTTNGHTGREMVFAGGIPLNAVEKQVQRSVAVVPENRITVAEVGAEAFEVFYWSGNLWQAIVESYTLDREK
jgi:hypothetical protein